MSTKIEWTKRINPDGSLINGDTWNPLIGCDKVSAGCTHCYAIQTAWIRMHNPKMLDKYAGTVKKTEGGKLNWTGQINMHEPSLAKPLYTKKPTTFFVNSMSDLFHEKVPFEFVLRVFTVMALCPQHTFQILTKRPERAAEYFEKYENGLDDKTEHAYDWIAYIHDKNGAMHPHLKEAGWLYDSFNTEFGTDTDLILDINVPLPNVWIGTSVENQNAADERIPHLLKLPAVVRFLSCEPLLGPLEFSDVSHRSDAVSALGQRALSGIDWVIAGGESGPGSRVMHPDWPRSIRDQCAAAGVAFFFKQWGEYTPIRPEGLFRDTERVDFTDNVSMAKVGKKAAGRLLDGVEYNEFPKTK